MITTHVLDTARGLPGIGISVLLEFLQTDGWIEIGRGLTDSDGRVGDLGGNGPGVYRLTFDVSAYLGPDAFYSRIEIRFRAGDREHYHVPLLLSPFGYTTYRGS